MGINCCLEDFILLRRHVDKNSVITVILVAFFYILFFIPNAILPKISDDFWYGEKDINIIATSLHHYLTWSGRIITDTTSRALLQLPSWFISSFKTLALVALIILIAILPSMILKRNLFSKTNLFFLFLVYWICNPNLGQTTFWTVGASNYLFTNVWILIYLNLVFYMYHHATKKFCYIFLAIAAFGAGLSNENTSPIVVLFSVGMLIYLLYKKENFRVWLIGAVFTVLGSGVLLLAPGNKVRQLSMPPKFRTGISLQKLDEFFTNGNAVKLFSNYGFLFLIFVFLIILLFFKGKVTKQGIFWSLLFFVMAILANFAFALAPFTMIRSLQGAFIFLLISLSFLMTEFLQGDRVPLLNWGLSAMLVVCSSLFMTSYVMEVNSFKLARTEASIRQSLIMQAKKDNQKETVIPGWYYGQLLRPHNDPYDPYLSPQMGHYYGYSGTIREVKMPFDYTNPKNFQKLDFTKLHSKVLTGVKLVKNDYSNNTTAVLLLKKFVKAGNITLKVHLRYNQTKVYELPLDDTLELKGQKFLALDLDGPLMKNDLKNADVIISSDSGDVQEHFVLK